MSTFPFARYRPGQRETIDRVTAAFDAGARYVVVEAPTGSGKSAIAVTLAREANSAYILTAQKLLQDQYLGDFPDLASMKGRSNYECLVAPTHAAAAPCIAGRTFPECEDCPYFRAKDVAIAANNAVMNYAYYLAELNYSGGFGRRELLVLDEAHNAEAALLGFVEVSVSDADLRRVGVDEPLPDGSADIDDLFDFAAHLAPRLRRRARALEARVRAGEAAGDGGLELLRQKQWLDGTVPRLETMTDSRDAGAVEWVVETGGARSGREPGDRRLAFKPVTVAAFADDVLFGFVDRVLMLSATILDAPTYLRSLGIDPDDAAVIEVPSDFPPENRPIEVRPAARLTRSYLERDLPRLVAEIDERMAAHPREKGIIHGHSYKICRAIEEGLRPENRARLVTHTSSAGRDAALDAHLSRPGPTVLLTPSMTEGIDLVGDLARWQVICKIPYPYLGDPQVARRKELDPAWYAWRTALTIVQAYGRSVRSADDRAVTYILDAGFPAFLARNRRRFPDWFVEAIRT